MVSLYPGWTSFTIEVVYLCSSWQTVRQLIWFAECGGTDSSICDSVRTTAGLPLRYLCTVAAGHRAEV